MIKTIELQSQLIESVIDVIKKKIIPIRSVLFLIIYSKLTI